MDKLGRTRPLAIDAEGVIRVGLPGATANTVPGYPDVYFIGGDPVLVLEPLPEDYQPYAPTDDNLPALGEA
jgi:hypothetical protein